jgi:hypothetical protein
MSATLDVLTHGDEPDDAGEDALSASEELTLILAGLDEPDGYFENLSRIAWDAGRFYALHLSNRVYRATPELVRALRSMQPEMHPANDDEDDAGEFIYHGSEEMDIEPDEEATRGRPQKRRRVGSQRKATRKRAREGEEITLSMSLEFRPPDLVNVLQSMPTSGEGWLQPEPEASETIDAQVIIRGNLLAKNLREAALELALLASEPRGAEARRRQEAFRAAIQSTLALHNEAAHELVVRLYFSILAEDSTTANKSFAVMGNPGTGKTSGFLRLAQLYYGMGVTAFAPNAEADIKTKSDFVAGFEGQTNATTLRTFYANVGRMIALDEAYQLDPRGGDAQTSAYNQEAVSTIIQTLGDPQGLFSLVLLGYETQTRALIDSNPGWSRRLLDVIVLPPLTPDDFVTRFLDLATQLSSFSRREHFLVVRDINTILRTPEIYALLAAKWNHGAYNKFLRLLRNEQARNEHSKLDLSGTAAGRYKALWARFVRAISDGAYGWTFTDPEWNGARPTAPLPSRGGRSRRD